MFSHMLFLKDDLQDNHWFGQSVMNPIDDQAFQKVKIIRESKNPENLLQNGEC